MGLCVWLVIMAGTVGATTFTVDIDGDASDTSPGDGQCASMSGACTIRAAVEEANATPGPDVVLLPPGRYRLAGETLVLSDDIELVGSGSDVTRIQGTRRFRLVEVRPEASATLRDLRLERGKAEIGGGILNEGSLALLDVTVAQSIARRPGGGLGGGIYNAGEITLTRVNLEQNFALGRIGGLGGSLYNQGTATLTETQVKRSRASGCGGGLYQNDGTLTVIDTSIERNSASNSGGGFFQQAGSAQMERVTLSSNRARQIGGGMFTYALLQLTNTTLSGNRASAGGGLFGAISPAVVLSNVTVAANRARQGAGLLNNGTMLLRNTIVADNRPLDCGGLEIDSLGNNLAGDTSCAFTRATDLRGVEAGLDHLAENGSRLRTHALLPGSPAIDSGDDSHCPPEDERSQPRPRDGNGDDKALCDRGAFEAQ